MLVNVASQQTPETGVVLYCDGSCRYGNPGYIGWGVHGYLYELKQLNKPVTTDSHHITNKGYVPANKPNKDINVVAVDPLLYFDYYGSSLTLGTNNKAEILAVYNGIINALTHNPKHIAIFTDSEYTINCITKWSHNWAKSNWIKHDGLAVANADILAPLYDIVNNLKRIGINFSIEWVKGHNEVMGNVQADILAVIGMNHSHAGELRNEFNTAQAKGYWKNEIEKHPFINFKRIYFNSVRMFNVPGEYYQADPGGGDFIIGKRIPESGFSVIKLTEPDHIVEAVKEKQYEVAKELNAIIMMKLTRVYSKEIYPYLVNSGKYCLLADKRNLNLNFIDDKPVTLEINPTGLSMRAIDSFNFLEELMADFLKYKEIGIDCASNNLMINFHDITDTFFSTEEKLVKKEVKKIMALKPEITNNLKDVEMEITEFYDGNDVSLNIPLIFGLDILPRNNLKKLETHNPSIYVLTWRESERTIKYATIIKCDSGIGIWANYFSNKLFL